MYNEQQMYNTGFLDIQTMNETYCLADFSFQLMSLFAWTVLFSAEKGECGFDDTCLCAFESVLLLLER